MEYAKNDQEKLETSEVRIMSGASWFPCYINDLLGSIRWKRMTPAQRGAYWQLICWQMNSDDGYLDDDIALLSMLADLDLSNGNSIVVEAFPVHENGRRANPRALAEWQKRRSISNARSSVGKAGIAKRWAVNSNCYSKRIALATTSTSTSTSTDTQPQSQGDTDSLEASRSSKPTDIIDPAVIFIPVVGNDDGFPVTSSQVEELKTLYPAVDVPQTLREIRGWNLANKARRKTARGVMRHVNAWMAREQNGGR